MVPAANDPFEKDATMTARALAHAAFMMIVLASSAHAYGANDEFQRYKQSMRDGVRKDQESFLEYRAEVTKQYDAYVAEQKRLFKEYTGKIESKWGAREVVTSTQKQYVSYEPDFASRSSVDFEKGTATVEVLLSEAEAKDPKLVEQRLKEQVAQLAVERGGRDPLEKKNSIPPEIKPILDAQLATEDGQPVTERNAKNFAAQSVRKAHVSQHDVDSKDGIKRIAVGIQIPLIPNHIKQRAKEFRETVKKETDRFGIDITLVYAIMHTESYFNPRARSSVAYGLMQLVPKSGARDAYLYAYKKDAMVTGDYLFDPRNNIELGTALLTKLLTVDFRGVTDPSSRVYCAISAYNTGSGNVAKAFGGKRNVNQALPQINAMTSDQVLAYLKQNLPYDETRTYVAKVSERMGIYDEWSRD